MFHLITILGPTASGKTALACRLAALLDGEIISADSRQVYRGMTIGTGKDLDDFTVEGKKIPYHLIDIVDPGYEFNVFEFQQHVAKVLPLIESNNHIPIVCGGSGMYLDAILRRYELVRVPENKMLRQLLSDYPQEKLVRKLKSYGSLHNTTDVTSNERLIRAIEIAEYQLLHQGNNFEMPLISSVNFGIRFERDEIKRRITQRLQERLENGMIQEVESLLGGGLTPDQLKFYGLEYRFVTQFLEQELSYDSMINLLNTAIHQFAKRQMTWFRRMEKTGIRIHWIDGELEMESKLSAMISMLPK